MHKNGKLLFFDIDGTLLTPYPFRVPESTQKALKIAQENGHYLFINSGRTLAMIPDMIKALEFDGYVCGCGSQIYMNKKLLYSVTNPNPLCRETVQKLREYRLPAFFECPDKILYDGAASVLPEALTHLRKQVPAEDLSLYGASEQNTYTFDKFLVFPHPQGDMERFRSFAAEHFTCFVHADAVLELTRKDCSKASGIQFLLEHLGLSKEDSYAFGDSTNDLPMLQYAGTSVAMGNSDKCILPFCTYQTTDVYQDGIANALRHLELI